MKLPTIKNTTLLVFFIIVYAFFAVPVYLVARQDLFEVMDGIKVGVCCGVALGYSVAAWNALKLPVHTLSSADLLVVGIMNDAIGGAMRFGGQWYWRAHNKPDWWIDSAFLLYTTLFLVVGSTLILSSTFTDKGYPVKNVFPRMGTVLAVIIVISCTLIYAGWG